MNRRNDGGWRPSPHGAEAAKIIEMLEFGFPFSELEDRAEEFHLVEAITAIRKCWPDLTSDDEVLDQLHFCSESTRADKEFSRLDAGPVCAHSRACFDRCAGIRAGKPCTRGYHSHLEAHNSELVRWMKNKWRGHRERRFSADDLRRRATSRK